MANNSYSLGRLLGFNSLLYHSWASWLGFCICKMGIIVGKYLIVLKIQWINAGGGLQPVPGILYYSFSFP